MSTKAEVVAAIDAALAVANNLDDQAATIATLTQQRDAAITERDAAQGQVTALQSKINAAKVKAQADKDADAANTAGQGVLDALA